MRMNNRYDEIINLPHHVSRTRPQMPMSDRAAQFAPFAALTGYDAAIKETGRLTDEKIELDEEALTALDMKYQLLMDTFDDAPEVTITYFQPDERKAGGKYVSAVGAVKKIDDFERRITMRDGTRIPSGRNVSVWLYRLRRECTVKSGTLEPDGSSDCGCGENGGTMYRLRRGIVRTGTGETQEYRASADRTVPGIPHRSAVGGDGGTDHGRGNQLY